MVAGAVIAGPAAPAVVASAATLGGSIGGGLGNVVDAFSY